MTHVWLYRLALLIVWPAIAAVVMASVAAALVIAWPLILFGRIEDKPDGGKRFTL